MKQGLSFVLACCSLWCASATAGNPNPYRAGFAQAASVCERVAKANPSQDEDTYFSAESCYRYQVATAIADSKECAVKGAHANRCASFTAQFDKKVQRAAKTDLVAAAVQAAPQYVGDTVQVALQSGLDTYQVVQVATAAHPAAEATIAQQAITFGADPTAVLTATAAGKAKGYQYDPEQGLRRK